jgi:DMSO/TMAO reductase YedYZ molybdopterin-dependent catalytic subunit
VTVSSEGKPAVPEHPSIPRGVATGLITAVLSLGVGQLVAGITGQNGSPVAAVGESAIDLTPPPVKNFAISAFGSHDKTVLVSGILVVLAVFAAVIGVLALRRLGYGLAGLAVFSAIGLAAAATRPDTGPADVLPSLAGAAAGAFVMIRLARAAAPRVPVPAPAPAPAEGRSGSDPGGTWAPAPPPADRRAPAPRRREFLVTGSAAVAVAGVGALAGRALAERSSVSQARATVRLPAPVTSAPGLPAGVDLGIKGLSPFVTPNGRFYRVDTALILPEVAPSTWHLRIHGMVTKEITLSYHDLLGLPLLEDWVTLTCVSNPVGGPYIGNARWLGTSLGRLLRAAGVKAGADQLLCTSTDGFTSGTPVQAVLDGRDAMLAVAMNGQPLPVAHGFPVRMVVPGLYGYVSATKWVTDIKVTTFAAERAYWVDRGWSRQAPIKTESRIDVPRPGAGLRSGRTAVAGVAWAQRRGVDAVEVRVDRGTWHRARLAAAPGIDTWRQWVWEWDAAPGRHLIEARATDATGYTQTSLEASPEPNGATGYPSVTVSVR